MISCDSLPDIHWFYYCYIVIHSLAHYTPPYHSVTSFHRFQVGGVTLPSSVTTQDSPSKLGLSSRCSIGSNSRVSSRLWTITSSWLSAWRRGEIKGENIVSGNWCGEKVKRWKGEIVVFSSIPKSWKGEKVKRRICEFVNLWICEFVNLWICEFMPSAAYLL